MLSLADCDNLHLLTFSSCFPFTNSSQNIRLESLGNLQHLEELKIRSVQGFALEDSLEAFARLTKLKALVRFIYL